MTDPDALQPITRTCQIIIVALIMGVVRFLAIVLLVIPARGNPVAPAPRRGRRSRIPAPDDFCRVCSLMLLSSWVSLNWSCRSLFPE